MPLILASKTRSALSSAKVRTCSTISKLTKVCKPTNVSCQDGWKRCSHVQTLVQRRFCHNMWLFPSFFLPETFNSSFKLTIVRGRVGERCAVTYKSQNSVFLPEYLTFFPPETLKCSCEPTNVSCQNGWEMCSHKQTPVQRCFCQSMWLFPFFLPETFNSSVK